MSSYRVNRARKFGLYPYRRTGSAFYLGAAISFARRLPLRDLKPCRERPTVRKTPSSARRRCATPRTALPGATGPCGAMLGKACGRAPQSKSPRGDCGHLRSIRQAVLCKRFARKGARTTGRLPAIGPFSGELGKGLPCCQAWSKVKVPSSSGSGRHSPALPLHDAAQTETCRPARRDSSSQGSCQPAESLSA